jgi:hypothetical protein
MMGAAALVALLVAAAVSALLLGAAAVSALLRLLSRLVCGFQLRKSE